MPLSAANNARAQHRRRAFVAVVCDETTTPEMTRSFPRSSCCSSKKEAQQHQAFDLPTTPSGQEKPPGWLNQPACAIAPG
jgi:hypothetical protein